jgi:hypothetical protein
LDSGVLTAEVIRNIHNNLPDIFNPISKNQYYMKNKTLIYLRLFFSILLLGCNNSGLEENQNTLTEYRLYSNSLLAYKNNTLSIFERNYLPEKGDFEDFNLYSFTIESDSIQYSYLPNCSKDSMNLFLKKSDSILIDDFSDFSFSKELPEIKGVILKKTNDKKYYLVSKNDKEISYLICEDDYCDLDLFYYLVPHKINDKEILFILKSNFGAGKSRYTISVIAFP